MSKSIRALISFEIIILPEETIIEGNLIDSGDDNQDKLDEKTVIDDLLSGNQWAWCNVEVRGEYLGLSASDYLGCCSYKSEQDFKTGGYYTDMIDIVATEIQDQYDKIKND